MPRSYVSLQRGVDIRHIVTLITFEFSVSVHLLLVCLHREHLFRYIITLITLELFTFMLSTGMRSQNNYF